VSLGKKDISKNISSKAHLSLANSQKLIESFLNLIKENSKYNLVKLSGFGTFHYKKSPSRVGRNPKTKKEYPISKRSKLIFSSSNKVKNFLN